MQPTYSRSSPGAFVLVLDTETTGTSFSSYEETFKKYQAIQFGAIIATSDTFEEVASLEFRVRYDPKYEWSKEAEAIHGITKEDLEKTGLSNEDAAAELAGFILDHFGTSKVLFAGHNPWFDIWAMRQLLEPYSVMPELFHVILDTSALGFITCGRHRSSDLFEFFLGKRAEKHNALDDARMTLTVMRTVRLLMNEALASLQV